MSSSGRGSTSRPPRVKIPSKPLELQSTAVAQLDSEATVRLRNGSNCRRNVEEPASCRRKLVQDRKSQALPVGVSGPRRLLVSRRETRKFWTVPGRRRETKTRNKVDPVSLTLSVSLLSDERISRLEPSEKRFGTCDEENGRLQS